MSAVELPGDGEKVATDLVGADHFQRVKLDIGGVGASSPVTQSNPLPVALEFPATQPVSVASLPLPAGAATEATAAAAAASVGVPADAPAGTDGGTYSLIALVKRLIGKIPGFGQSPMATSLPVVVASDQAPIPIAQPVVTASGNITTQNLVPAGAATAGSAVEINLNGANALTVQVSGTYTGALTLQGTVNGAVWVTLAGVPLLNVNTGGYLAAITSGLQSIFQSDVGGFAKARITGLAAMTGTASISMAAGTGAASMMALDASLPAGANNIGIVDTELPAAAALADGFANPTTPTVGAASLLYNGTTWDRYRSNFNTTTGDTGAKTTTFNGATQTNYNARGALVTFNIGVVSGTSPTFVGKIQSSPDGGTTWIDIPGALTASIVATGVYSLLIHPEVPAAANAVAQYVLPRTWRVVGTIGGTTPSFALTNVQVAYVN